jgi:RNA polymerase sigma factor (TIGR02999 family)
MSEVTRILSALEQGDPHAAEQLLPLVYDELRKLAAEKMAQERPGQTLQATALVHEAYLRLVDVDEARPWNSRGHFFAAAAEAMRRILVEQTRRKRGGARQRIDLDLLAATSPPRHDDLLDLDEALSQLATADPQAAELVKLCYFAGRKRLAAQAPRLPRGRPKNTAAAQRLRQRARALARRVAELFDERHLFVRHHLSAGQRVTLRRLTRGLPQLRALRAIMEEVYRLFDRRCRTDTALARVAQLRQQLRRYRSLGKSLDRLHSSNLEKALTFPDDKLLPATSNAVERNNRRVRKMQKTVYRVRMQESLRGRLGPDLQRDQQAEGRQETLSVLHERRS